MARLGGRNRWIAAPAMLLCVAVVAALVWLALPMFPVAISWAGDTLRSAGERAAGATERPGKPQGAEAVDCRGLYPDVLWSALMWRGGSRLDQDRSPPATAAGGVTEALSPAVRLNCRWIYADAELITTVSQVAADAAPIAEAGLRGQGFACATADGVLVCTREQGDVREEHALRDGLWLSNVERGWHPEDFGAQLTRHVFG